MYTRTESISETSLQTEISTTKVRKILITIGLWSSPRSLQIQELAVQGMTTSEIAEALQISTTMVQNYRPYERGLYDEPGKTDTAVRSEKYRERNRRHAKRSRNREQPVRDASGISEGIPTQKEKSSPYAMHLHLELRGSQLNSMSAEEAKVLTTYGGVKKSISRDIMVPSSLVLHQLHYLINMVFGWTNSHLHSFQLPLPLYQVLTEGKLLDIAPVFGYYLQFPNITFADAFWDDDYDESKSPRTWMRSKYLRPYAYGGYSEYWIENQVEIHQFAERFPILHVQPLWPVTEVEPRDVRFEEATLQELLDAVTFDEGMPDVLKESLRMHEILSLQPKAIESAKADALAVDTGLIQQYRQYRDQALTAANYDRAACNRALVQMERLQKQAEPKRIMPISTELTYSYDYGDGWEVEISLIREFGNDTQAVEDETAARVIADRKPICIAKDGLNVLDDCGGMSGYMRMLQTIHGDDRDEAAFMKDWARGQGWTGRNVNPKNMT